MRRAELEARIRNAESLCDELRWFTADTPYGALVRLSEAASLSLEQRECLYSMVTDVPVFLSEGEAEWIVRNALDENGRIDGPELVRRLGVERVRAALRWPAGELYDRYFTEEEWMSVFPDVPYRAEVAPEDVAAAAERAAISDAAEPSLVLAEDPQPDIAEEGWNRRTSTACVRGSDIGEPAARGSRIVRADATIERGERVYLEGGGELSLRGTGGVAYLSEGTAVRVQNDAPRGGASIVVLKPDGGVALVRPGERFLVSAR